MHIQIHTCMYIYIYIVNIRIYICIYIHLHLSIYISAEPSACGLRNSIWLDSKREVERSEVKQSEAKSEAKRKRSEAKRTRKRSEKRSVAQTLQGPPGSPRDHQGPRWTPGNPPRVPGAPGDLQGSPKAPSEAPLRCPRDRLGPPQKPSEGAKSTPSPEHSARTRIRKHDSLNLQFGTPIVRTECARTID